MTKVFMHSLNKNYDSTNSFKALTTLVIHWLTNPKASHSLILLVQCNPHLVVLPYLKLLFQLHIYY